MEDEKKGRVGGGNNFKELKWLNQFLLGHKGFIAGGCFKNIFNNQKVKDVDIYFNNSKDYDEAVKYFEISTQKYKLEYTNKNVKAFRHLETNTVVELISCVFGTPTEVLDTFDFTIVKFAYYQTIYYTSNAENGIESETQIEFKVEYHESFFEHLLLKLIVLDDKILKPTKAFSRILKYTKYGYNITTESKRKLMKAIQKMPQTDLETTDDEANYD